MKPKPKEILAGWKNLIFPKEEVERIASQRMNICNTCEFKIEQCKINVCGVCHCPLIAKTRSMQSECPKQKWDKYLKYE